MINPMFLKLAYKNLMRRKTSTFVNIFLLSIVMLIILITFSTTKSLNSFLDKMFVNHPRNYNGTSNHNKFANK